MTSFDPVWTTIEGLEDKGVSFPILRAPGSNYAAFPVYGRKSDSRFQVFEVKSRRLVCQLTKKEVRSWLFRAARGEAEDIERAAEDAAMRATIATEKAAAKAARAARKAAEPVQLSLTI